MSFCVEGGFGIPGDSGAWVYDPVSGGLCGHVLAWGEKSKTAYIAPMEVLFEDIKRTLGAGGVELPLPEGVHKPGTVVKEDSGIGIGTKGEEIASKLREMRLDENRNPNPALGGGPSGNAASAGNAAAGAPGGGGKAKGVVGVRPLVMAGAVS